MYNKTVYNTGSFENEIVPFLTKKLVTISLFNFENILENNKIIKV